MYQVIRQSQLGQGRKSVIQQPLLLSILLLWALLPDLDAIPGFLAGDLGRFHNNITHSLTAAFTLSILPALILWQLARSSFLSWYFTLSICYASHIFLDFITHSQRGLLLFWPFDLRRVESGVTLFYGVRWSEGLISSHHLVTLISELGFSGLVITGMWVWKRAKPIILGSAGQAGDQ